MIVKFQRPIFEGNMILIYDRKETIYQKIPATKDLITLMKGRRKIYCQCTLDRGGRLHIGREVRGHF